MKDISFDYSRRSLSQTKYSSSWTLLSSSGWDSRGRSREGGVFQRYRRFIYDACKRSRVEAEIDNVRFRIPRFLVCHDETCILRFVEAWSLFSNIYYIRLIFLIPRWRVSVFTKEFKRFLFNFCKISLSRCKSAPTKMWIRTSFRSETKEEIPASTLLPFSLPFPPLIPRRVNSDGKRIKLFSPLENREPAGSFPFCPAKKFDRRRLTLWLPRFIFNEIFFRHALIF